MGEANHAKVDCEEPPAVMANGTKNHSIYPTLNEVHVVIGYPPGTRWKTLLHASVNRDWNHIAEEACTST